MTLHDHSVAVVVPAYNEEHLIAETITTIPDFVDSIIVVDDASTDATSDRASGTGDGRVTLLRNEVNTGVGGAILTGHREALRLGADVAVVMAGDAQMPPEHLERLLEPVLSGRADYSKGNRLASSQMSSEMPLVRRWGSVVLTMLTRAATGFWQLNDSQNGYTAVSRSMLERIDMESIDRRYSFENSMLIALSRLGARVEDVAIPPRYGSEESGMRIATVGPQIAWVLVRAMAERAWGTVAARWR